MKILLNYRISRLLNFFPLRKAIVLFVVTGIIMRTCTTLVLERPRKPELDPESAAVQKEIEESGNMPWSYFQSNVTKMTSAQVKALKLVRRCSKRPLLVDLRFSNLYWQMVTIKTKGSNLTDIYGYNAYIDTRQNKSLVQILVDSHDHLMIERIKKPKFCQIWYPGAADPYISKVININYLWKKGSKMNDTIHHYPFLISCSLPQKPLDLVLQTIPESVSLVVSKCDYATNNLRINYIAPSKKQDFGVCLKWFDFPTEDLSIRLIEWIEMVLILGASKIHFTVLAAHPNVLKVMEYYKGKGRVTFKKYNFPGYQPNSPQLRSNFIYHLPNRGPKLWLQEIIPYTDCFYTYMHSFNHIVNIDIDEVILPVSSPNWSTLLEDAKISNKDTPCFKMLVFTTKLVGDLKVGLNSSKAIQESWTDMETPYMMKQLNTSSVCSSKEKPKCFFSTSNVVVVHNHFPRQCLSKPCQRSVKTSIAYVHHHRPRCDLSRFKYNRNNLLKSFKYDPTILKYKDELISRRDDVLVEINL